MDYITSINRAIDYIENHLTQAISVEDMAAVAGYSRFHFDRLFLAMLGETPASYLRKRRLSEAARELITSKKPILDIALDYQFQSQEAFTRPFRAMFGFSPGAYRKRRRFTRAFSRVTLSRQKLPQLNAGAARNPEIIVSGQSASGLLPICTYAVFIYGAPVSLQKCPLERVHLFYW
jgi:AraC family transcriptional regulator